MWTLEHRRSGKKGAGSKAAKHKSSHANMGHAGRLCGSSPPHPSRGYGELAIGTAIFHTEERQMKSGRSGRFATRII